MISRFDRISTLVTGLLAVCLWIAGLAVGQGLTDNLSDGATDAKVLAWLQANKNPTIVGGWLFMTGCIAFIWFAGLLRSRLAEAEGDRQTLSTIGFAGAVAAAVFGIGTQADVGSAINASDVSPATAGMFHHLGDLFFVGAEISLIVLLASVCVLAFRTAALPRWWGVFSGLVAVILWIGPIGWAALIFGTPVWTLGTTILLVRAPRPSRSSAIAGPSLRGPACGIGAQARRNLRELGQRRLEILGDLLREHVGRRQVVRVLE
jgi:hypothetical protein